MAVRNLEPVRRYDGGGSVTALDWHPSKGLIAGGSDDYQIRLWDPRASGSVGTIHEHTGAVTTLSFNQNGAWLLSASEDSTVRVFDIRVNREMQRFKGHAQAALAAAWHPLKEDVCASTGEDGALLFWAVGHEAPCAEDRAAHDAPISQVAWHPAGHVLATGSRDAMYKLWTRPRPGEPFRANRKTIGAAAPGPEAAATPLAMAGMKRERSPPRASAIPGIGAFSAAALPGLGTSLDVERPGSGAMASGVSAFPGLGPSGLPGLGGDMGPGLGAGGPPPPTKRSARDVPPPPPVALGRGKSTRGSIGGSGATWKRQRQDRDGHHEWGAGPGGGGRGGRGRGGRGGGGGGGRR